MTKLAPFLAALALALAPAAVQAAVPGKLSFLTAVDTTHPKVHVALADGSGAVTLGTGVQAKLSPDGTAVAILTPSTRTGMSLVVRPSSGGAARTLLRAGASLGPLAWSPDGTRLLVTVNRAHSSQLVAIDVADGRHRVVARGSQIEGASFSPDGTRIAYARLRGQRLSSPVNVFVTDVAGSSRRALTHDGRSLWPIWGPSRIAYTHERLRRGDAPVYQLRTMRPDGSDVRQLTHMRIPPLLSGLMPTAWSADGQRLLAEYGGQDTSEAWTVDIPSGRVRDLTGRRDDAIGYQLSADGGTVLVQLGHFDDPTHQSVATIPFGGGRPTVLVRLGSAPSWGG